MQKKDLLKIGFTKEESNTFILLLELGPSSTEEVKERSDLTLEELTEALEGLREKQLAKAVTLWGKIYYSPIAEEDMIDALDKAREIIEGNKRAELQEIQKDKVAERLKDLMDDEDVTNRLTQKEKDQTDWVRWQESKVRLDEEHKSKVKGRLDDLVDEKDQKLKIQRRQMMRARLMKMAGKKREAPKAPDVTVVLEDILLTQKKKILDQINPIFSDDEKVEIKRAITQILSSKAAFMDQKKDYFKKR
ncbi:MAG: helix-turn-helix domain-containing protein [Candidatus Altiarchaeota archaeon]